MKKKTNTKTPQNYSYSMQHLSQLALGALFSVRKYQPFKIQNFRKTGLNNVFLVSVSASEVTQSLQ